MLSCLYACVLGSEVDGAVVGRVSDAEDVSDIVGRPERIEMLERRRAPDLQSQYRPISSARVPTLTIGSAALENSSFRSCDRHRPSTLPLCAWMTLRRSYVSRL
jgi:hypothetical protein